MNASKWSARTSQKIALQPQGHGRLRFDDSLTSLLDIDIEDGFLSHLLRAGLRAERSHQPVLLAIPSPHCEQQGRSRREVIRVQREHKTYQTVATPYLRLVRTTERISTPPSHTNIHPSR